MEKYLHGNIQNLEKGAEMSVSTRVSNLSWSQSTPVTTAESFNRRTKPLVAFPTADKRCQMLVFFIRYKSPSLVVWNYQKLTGFTVSAQQAVSLVIYTFHPIYGWVNKSCNAHFPHFYFISAVSYFSFASPLSVTACSSCIVSGYYSHCICCYAVIAPSSSLMRAIWLRIKNNLLSVDFKNHTVRIKCWWISQLGFIHTR